MVRQINEGQLQRMTVLSEVKVAPEKCRWGLGNPVESHRISVLLFFPEVVFSKIDKMAYSFQSLNRNEIGSRKKIEQARDLIIQ